METTRGNDPDHSCSRNPDSCTSSGRDEESGTVKIQAPDYGRFIEHCIVADGGDDHGLTDDEMYGLFLSWCHLQLQSPTSGTSFRAAMSAHGLQDRRRSNRRYIRPGLRMTGPAAVDYILANRPSLYKAPLLNYGFLE